jgi:hypothetical protein
MYACVFACLHRCMQNPYMYLHIQCVCVCACVQLCMYVCAHEHAFIYLHTCVCIHIFAYIHTYMWIEKIFQARVVTCVSGGAQTNKHDAHTQTHRDDITYIWMAATQPTYTCMHAHTHTTLHMYLESHNPTNIYMYAHTHTHTQHCTCIWRVTRQMYIYVPIYTLIHQHTRRKCFKYSKHTIQRVYLQIHNPENVYIYAHTCIHAHIHTKEMLQVLEAHDSACISADPQPRKCIHTCPHIHAHIHRGNASSTRSTWLHMYIWRATARQIRRGFLLCLAHDVKGVPLYQAPWLEKAAYREVS